MDGKQVEGRSIEFENIKSTQKILLNAILVILIIFLLPLNDVKSL